METNSVKLLLFFLCLIHFLDLRAKASFLKKKFSIRKAPSDCGLIYMCPSFCLKMKADCYTCECGNTMETFMDKSSAELQQQYQTPVFQTGSKFMSPYSGTFSGGNGTGATVSGTADGTAHGTAFVASSGVNAWISPGGSDAGSPKWIGQQDQHNGGSIDAEKKKIGIYNQQEFAPLMTSYLLPDFQEFYRTPNNNFMPGKCQPMKSVCPGNCWKVDGFTGCMKCACHAKIVTPSPDHQTAPTQRSTPQTTTPPMETLTVTPLQVPKGTLLPTTKITEPDEAKHTILTDTTMTSKVTPNSHTTSINSSTLAMSTTNSHDFKEIMLQILEEGNWHNLNDLLQILQKVIPDSASSPNYKEKEFPTSTTTVSTTTMSTTTIPSKSVPKTTLSMFPPLTTTMTTAIPIFSAPIGPLLALLFASNSNFTDNTSSTSVTDNHKQQAMSIAGTPCPSIQCTKECLRHDPISNCYLCTCGTAATEHAAIDSGQISTIKRCDVMTVGCPDVCILLDQHACPICKCPDPVLKIKNHEVGVKCSPISPNCPQKCMGFDDNLCVKCAC